MTFEEWYNKTYPEGVNTSKLEHQEDIDPHYFTPVMEYEIRDLMKEAWDARYSTLTWNDI